MTPPVLTLSGITKTFPGVRALHHVALELYADLPGGETFIALFEGDPKIDEGVPLEIGFPLTSAHLFDAAGLAVY